MSLKRERPWEREERRNIEDCAGSFHSPFCSNGRLDEVEMKQNQMKDTLEVLS